MRTFFVFLSLLCGQLYAQPGDPSFNILLLNKNSIINCKTDNYKILSYRATFPTYIDSLGHQQVRTNPDWSTLQLHEQLTCVPAAQVLDTLLPFTHYFAAESLMNAAVLAIINPQNDTMWITCLDRWPLRNSKLQQNSQAVDIPFTIVFQKGHHKLSDLLKNKSRLTRQQKIYAQYLKHRLQPLPPPPVFRGPELRPTKKQQDLPPPPKKNEPQASLHLDKDTLHYGDTLNLRLNGRILLDGGCASSRPISCLEQHQNGSWTTIGDCSLIQMDCGLSSKLYDNELITFYKIMPALSQYGFALAAGTYRFVYYDGEGQPIYAAFCVKEQ